MCYTSNDHAVFNRWTPKIATRVPCTPCQPVTECFIFYILFFYESYFRFLYCLGCLGLKKSKPSGHFFIYIFTLVNSLAGTYAKFQGRPPKHGLNVLVHIRWDCQSLASPTATITLCPPLAYWVHSYTEYVKVKLLAYEFDFILVLGGQFFDIFCSKLVYCLQSCLGVQERHRFVLKTKWTDFGVNYYSTAHLIRKRPIKKSCRGLAKHKKVRESSPWN